MAPSPFVIACVVCLFGPAAAQHDKDEHDGHDHGDAAYEWAGMFEVPKAEYMWTAQKVDGAYADATMKMAVLPAALATATFLDALKDEGAHSLEADCTAVQHNSEINPMAGRCYKLVFDQVKSQSSFRIDTSDVAAVAFFTEHVPTEFENTAHYFKDTVGEDVEPVAQFPEGSHDGHDHGGGHDDGGHDGHDHGDGHDGHDHGDGHDGHDHGDAAYEWAGIFEVPKASYMWTAQKVDGAYADATMKMAVLPAPQATANALDALKKEGVHSLEADCTAVGPNGVIIPMADKCYKLVYDQEMWQSLYRIDTGDVAAVAFFTEHVPTEFENTAHYLKDNVGEDVEPAAELPIAKEEEDSTEWAGSIIASVIVNLVTLCGVILAVPGIRRMADKYSDIFQGVLFSFAAGALLACAFFLLLFEATHYIATGWDEEVEVLWRWGIMILAGFLLPATIEGTFGMILEARTQPCTSSEAQIGTEQSPGGEQACCEDPDKCAAVRKRTNARVISAVSVGDFFHNLCDGFFIGAAFKGCGSGFGWGVAMATVLHEIPQEVADYAVLTSMCSLRPAVALGINFLSGLSVLLGTIIINVSDIDNAGVGLVLSFGGGVYLYIAAVECMPRVHALKLPARQYLVCLFAWVIGAILIGLILLDHEHCVPDDGSGAHDGHDHGGDHDGHNH